MFPNVTYKISNCCTVTCRQFPNLTFAPRKTCHQGSNLTLHSYQCHSSCYYTPSPKVLQAFFQFFTTFFIFLQNAQKASFLCDAFSDFYLISLFIFSSFTVSHTNCCRILFLCSFIFLAFFNSFFILCKYLTLKTVTHI